MPNINFPNCKLIYFNWYQVGFVPTLPLKIISYLMESNIHRLLYWYIVSAWEILTWSMVAAGFYLKDLLFVHREHSDTTGAFWNIGWGWPGRAVFAQGRAPAETLILGKDKVIEYEIFL